MCVNLPISKVKICTEKIKKPLEKVYVEIYFYFRVYACTVGGRRSTDHLLTKAKTIDFSTFLMIPVSSGYYKLKLPISLRLRVFLRAPSLCAFTAPRSIHLFIRLLVRLFVCSFVNSFIHLFIHSFILTFADLLRPPRFTRTRYITYPLFAL